MKTCNKVQCARWVFSWSKSFKELFLDLLDLHKSDKRQRKRMESGLNIV